jgi:hypothetical protein
MEESDRLRRDRVSVPSRTTRRTIMSALPALGSRALGGWIYGENSTSHCIRHESDDLNLETRRCGLARCARIVDGFTKFGISTSANVNRRVWASGLVTGEMGNFLSTVLHRPEALLGQVRIGAQGSHAYIGDGIFRVWRMNHIFGQQVRIANHEVYICNFSRPPQRRAA